jgi:hypothetical protein
LTSTRTKSLSVKIALSFDPTLLPAFLIEPLWAEFPSLIGVEEQPQFSPPIPAPTRSRVSKSLIT